MVMGNSHLKSSVSALRFDAALGAKWGIPSKRVGIVNKPDPSFDAVMAMGPSPTASRPSHPTTRAPGRNNRLQDLGWAQNCNLDTTGVVAVALQWSNEGAVSGESYST
jgi:hypothetical protein